MLRKTLQSHKLQPNMGDYGGNREDVDLEKYPTAKKLVEKCIEFFDEVQNL